MNRKLALLAVGALVLPFLAFGAGGSSSSGRTYTDDADFDAGQLINVVHATPGQLQLDSTTKAFGFIWVAVSTKGTAVKIDTTTGKVLGEYRTAPQGQPTDPSRTTVDKNGNVWVANRAGNSIAHFGLLENNQCVDRNGNGVIDTSTGLNDIRPWPNTGGANTNGGVTLAADECILHYTKVSSSGTRHVSVDKDNNVWVSGTGNRRFDLVSGATGTILRKEPSVGYGGYGGLITKDGVIWSARNHLRWDTSKPLTGANGVNWKGLTHDSYGLCIDPAGNVWETELDGNRIRKWSSAGVLLGTFGHGFTYAQGCVADANGDIWVAHSILGGGNTVGHLKNNGAFVGNVPVGNGPTGVAVDSNGKVWATNYFSRTVSRIDPNAGPLGPDGVTRVGAVDLVTVDLGGNIYNYSDMTGSTLTGAPNVGSWTVVYDSLLPGAEWGRVSWTANTPGDSKLTVGVASSAVAGSFGPSVPAASGVDLTVPNGRYLKVTVVFQRASTGESPVLFDLTAEHVALNKPPVAEAGGPYAVPEGGAVGLDGSASMDPDNDALTYAWDLDGDAVFETPGVAPSFSALGLDGPSTRTVVLRVCDPDDACATDSAVVDVTNVGVTPDAGLDQTVFRFQVADLAGTFVDPAADLDNPYSWTWDVPGDASSGTAAYGDVIARTAAFDLEGEYDLDFYVTDKDGSGGVDRMRLTVLNQAPDCSAAAPSQASLWPPNHQLVPILVLGLSDPEGDALTTTILGIHQDEDVDVLGDGNFAPDGDGVGSSIAMVRAERSGTPKVPGDGRVYHIAFLVEDGHGGACAGEVVVGVPHDRDGTPPVDGGPLFDSLNAQPI